MHSHERTDHRADFLLAVRSPEDIEFLVKESEVLTGRSGRTFVIAGADRLFYLVHWQIRGQSSQPIVERLDASGRIVCRQRLELWELLEHSLVEAQAAGQLFTAPVKFRT